jgi:hypothetical protein
MTNVCAHLSTHKGANDGDGQHYLADQGADNGMDRVVDDVAEYRAAPSNSAFHASRLASA